MKTWMVFVGIWLGLIAYGPLSIHAQDADVINGGLTYEDIEIGTGTEAFPGDIVTVHMIGWVGDHDPAEEAFFNSYDGNTPISFKLGTQRVMPGWNLGIPGMKVGGRRILRIPSELGYGAKGVSGVVPPNADVTFEVELVEVKNKDR